MQSPEGHLTWNCDYCGAFMFGIGYLGITERIECGECGKANLVVICQRNHPITELEFRLLARTAILNAAMDRPEERKRLQEVLTHFPVQAKESKEQRELVTHP